MIFIIQISFTFIDLRQKEGFYQFLEIVQKNSDENLNKKLIETPEQEVIKEVINNEMENPENVSITNKKVLLTDKINDHLTNNSALVIDNFEAKLIERNVNDSEQTTKVIEEQEAAESIF